MPTIEKLVRDTNGLTRDEIRRRMKEVVPEFCLEAPAPLPAAIATPAPEASAALPAVAMGT